MSSAAEESSSTDSRLKTVNQPQTDNSPDVSTVDSNVNKDNYVNDQRNSLDQEENNKTDTEISRLEVRCDGAKMFRYGREVVCIIALLLTTYATIQNKPLKFGRAPLPTSFFPINSAVQDFPGGQLSTIQVGVSMSELSLVFFYAPWCAESQHARKSYERVATMFHEEVYFTAVNCWQPGGECRLQYSKVHSWPVLMAYFQGGFAVQYTDQWTVLALTKFVENLMIPLQRLSNSKSLLKLRAENDAVVVGYFKNARSKEFSAYLRTAVKWLEHDPFQDLKFGVVTGVTAELFNISTSPSLVLYLWNQTLSFSENHWNLSNITNWIKSTEKRYMSWLSLPGRKSSMLLNNLLTSPSMVVFAPRNYFQTNDYFAVKQVAWEYNHCGNQSLQLDLNFISRQAEENKIFLENLERSCHYTQSVPTRSLTAPNCDPDGSNLTNNFVNIVLETDYSSARSNGYCPLKCDRFQSFQSYVDDRSPESLQFYHRGKLCQKLELFKKRSSREAKVVSVQPVTGLGCKFNSTLSFLMLDSVVYRDFLKRLNGRSHERQNSAIFILDNDNESTYKLNESISFASLRTFVRGFHEKTLVRTLREKKVDIEATNKTAKNTKVKVSEINYSYFKNSVETSNSTFVILFYSSQCALCTIISQTMLRLSKVLKSLDINYVRVDGDNNDFPWQYTMESYPTLIILPRRRRMETRVFPHNVEVNEKNVLGFILANLDFPERLSAMAELCHNIKGARKCQNCLLVLIKETSKSIDENLSLWRHRVDLRSKISKVLEILREGYLSAALLTGKNCDVSGFKELSTKLRNVWSEWLL